MKNIETSPTVRNARQLQKAFDYFNQSLFKNELPNVLLNLSRAGKTTAGFFWENQWKDNDSGEKIHELSLCPKFLQREIDVVFSTLVHEMAHLWQTEHGKTSRNGYHNRQWADKMLEVGLTPKANGAKGGMTGQSVSHEITPDGSFARVYAEMPEEFKMAFTNLEQEKKPKKATRTKYTCPKCGSIAYGKPNLGIICKSCAVMFDEETN